MLGTPSAWIGFAGGVVGGLVSATLGQVLVIFRRRYQHREDLKRILTELSDLEERDVKNAKKASNKDGLGDEPANGVHIWQLRSELRETLSRSYSFLNPKTRDKIQQVIDNYGFFGRHLDSKATTATATAHETFTNSAQDALNSLDNEPRPRVLNISIV